jgi:hypothetical protein
MLNPAAIPEEFRSFATSQILPQLRLRGYKLAEKQELAVQLLHALVWSGQSCACVADRRGTQFKGTRLRVAVWDAIVYRDFAMNCLGSEVSAKLTRYYATPKLLDRFTDWQLAQLVQPQLPRGTTTRVPTPDDLVRLRRGRYDRQTGVKLPRRERRRLLPLSITPESRDYWSGVEDTVDKINSANLDHSWKAFRTDPVSGKQRAFQPDVRLHLTYVGTEFSGGRFYTRGPRSAQKLPKAERRAMLIDGARTAELDYGGMQVRMRYHGKLLEPPAGDVYQVEAILPTFYASNPTDEERATVRGFIKKATAIVFNTTSAKPVKAVRYHLRNDDQADFVLRVVHDVEGIDAAELIARIKRVHQPLAKLFHTHDARELMTTEGKIIKRVMLAFVAAGKPALPIHDSVVCKVSDAAFAKRVMTDAYEACHPGRRPVVNRAY